MTRIAASILVVAFASGGICAARMAIPSAAGDSCQSPCCDAAGDELGRADRCCMSGPASLPGSPTVERIEASGPAGPVAVPVASGVEVQVALAPSSRGHPPLHPATASTILRC